MLKNSNTLKQIYKDAEYFCDYDNRNYYVKSLNKLINAGILKLDIIKKGFYKTRKDGTKYDLKVSICGWNRIRHCSGNNSIHPDPSDVLLMVARLLQNENVKTKLNAMIQTPGSCSKCKGSGVIPYFMYYANGICFDCGGIGSDFVKLKVENVKLK